MNELIVFEKDQKSKDISLGLLKQTASLADPFSGLLPNSRPIEHWQLIEQISETVDKAKLKYKLDPIWISKGESKKIRQLDPDNVGIPESYLFQRLVTRINILTPDFVQHGVNTSIAIGYTERGIQIAFGANVKICSNMCIFGGNLMHTYGDNKMRYDKMMQLVEKNIQELDSIAKRDFHILDRFRDTPINQQEMITSIGELHIQAVQGTYFGGQSPLNIGQVSNLTKGLVKLTPDILTTSNDNIISLFDFYNMGTEILHPSKTEITTLLPDTLQWGNYLTNRYNLN